MKDSNKKQQEQQQVPLTEEQKYLDNLLNKFNTNPDDVTLSSSERSILQKIGSVEKEINNLAQKFVQLNTEVKDKQEEMSTLNQQIVLKRGQSQGLVESLVILRPVNENKDNNN